jgi:hypothetical protein
VNERRLPGETLGEYRRLDTATLWRRADETFARSLAKSMPERWAATLFDDWRRRWTPDGQGAQVMRELVARCDAINHAQRAGVRPESGDAELIQQAKDCARDAARRIADTLYTWAAQGIEVATRATLDVLHRWMQALGLVDEWHTIEGRQRRKHGWSCATRTPRAILLRMQCERTWRRLLRRVHARSFEAIARGLGLVHKLADCYVSDDSLKRRTAQRARNAAALEATTAINEHAEAFTLAELAAKGPANREIRRCELMARIAGFELIAKESRHQGLFITLTCPSRMHKMRTRYGGHGVEPNPRFDGTDPRQAQQWLSQQWAKARAAAVRKGIEWYGFRIAEPQHDATPHWHCLLFVPGEPKAATEILRRYFLLADSPDEPGALRHRVRVVRINWDKGSAAGYIAKYVAKNIDGYRVEKDLYGNDAMAASQRVDAWAATWRIRQFQQIGGAPVTVWRELRRLHLAQAEASPLVAHAIDAVNATRKADAADPDDESAAHGWAAYLHLQGGPRPKRSALRITLWRELTGEVGRYSETLAPKPVGVIVNEVQRLLSRPGGIVMQAIEQTRATRTEVESERCDWLIVPKGNAERARAVALARAAGVRPWSPVNNCTRPTVHPVPLFARAHTRRRKVGRVMQWKRPAAAAPPAMKASE